MTKTKRVLMVVLAVPMVLVMAIAAMHEPRHQVKVIVREPVAEAEDIDFLMHDLEQARQEANAAYAKITDASRRAVFDGEDIHGWKP